MKLVIKNNSATHTLKDVKVGQAFKLKENPSSIFVKINAPVTYIYNYIQVGSKDWPKYNWQVFYSDENLPVTILGDVVNEDGN